MFLRKIGVVQQLPMLADVIFYTDYIKVQSILASVWANVQVTESNKDRSKVNFFIDAINLLITNNIQIYFDKKIQPFTVLN